MKVFSRYSPPQSRGASNYSGPSEGKEAGDITRCSGLVTVEKGPPYMNAISAHLTTLVFVAQQRLGKATKGATAVEYGLLVALIAAVIIAAVTVFGTTLSTVFKNVADSITSAA
jgi:pilus assembly protein Flp/PilA